MSSFSKIITAGVTIGALVLIWYLAGQDTMATVDYVQMNWATVALGVQIVVMFILAATKHYIGAGLLLITSLATIFGVVL